MPNRNTDSFGGGERWLYSFIVQQRGKYSRLVSQELCPFSLGNRERITMKILHLKKICLFAFGYILDALCGLLSSCGAWAQ